MVLFNAYVRLLIRISAPPRSTKICWMYIIFRRAKASAFAPMQPILLRRQHFREHIYSTNNHKIVDSRSLVSKLRLQDPADCDQAFRLQQNLTLDFRPRRFMMVVMNSGCPSVASALTRFTDNSGNNDVVPIGHSATVRYPRRVKLNSWGFSCWLRRMSRLRRRLALDPKFGWDVAVMNLTCLLRPLSPTSSPSSWNVHCRLLNKVGEVNRILCQR